MRAIRVHQFGGPEVLTLEQVPDPSPGAGEVVVRLHAAGVNPVEAYVRTGQYARLPALPYIPGYDGAGVVEAVGADVKSVKAGDRVYVAAFLVGSGTYAERVRCPATHVHPLPEHVSFAQGAAVGVPAATAWRALVLRANARPAETVLVHGASGAVGVAAVQLARAMGLRVFGTAGSDKGVEVAQRAGCHQVFRHDQPGYENTIAEAAAPDRINVILENLANVNLDRDLGLIAPKGRVIVIGNRGRTEIDARQTMGKESAVMGTTLWSATADEYRMTHAALVAALAAGTLAPIVGTELPLERAADAHRAVIGGKAAGKIVLTMD